MFLEVSMAAFILVAAFGVIAQLLVVTAQQKRVLESRRLATREAANLMERVMANPWGELTADRVASLDLPDTVKRRLRDARVNIGITAEEESPQRKRIRVRVDWSNRAGQRERPVQLVAWKYQLEAMPSP